MSTPTVTDPDPAPPPPEPVTPVDLIGFARDARKRREQADHDVLRVGLEWALAHEVHGPPTRERSGAPGAPGDFPEGGPVEDLDGAIDTVPDVLLTRLERAARAAEAAQEPSPKPQPAQPPGPAEPAGPAGPAGPVGPVGTRVDPTLFEESEARRRWRGLPDLTWDCAAPLATALGLPTRGGWVLLRQGLTLKHRLPRTYRAWATGQVQTRVARMIADKVVGQPDDVCAWVDTQLATRIRDHHGIGPVVAERLVQEAMTHLHAEELELERQEQLHARYARYALSVETTDGQTGPDRYGLAEFVIRGDWPDIKAFNDTIAALADAIRHSDLPEAGETLDVRRSIAVGILADPARALAMLTPDPDTDAGKANPVRKQSMLATFNLAGDPDGPTPGRPGRSPVATDDLGRVWLDTVLREWAGRPDVDLTVRPVIHCGGCPQCDTYCQTRHQRTGYTPTDLDREHLRLWAPVCVFPHCHTPAQRSDCDHITPYDADDPTAGGPTCPRCNLAPLCRHHHRLKTHAGWAYRQIEPGLYTWTEPHGQTFTTTRWATHDTTDQQQHDQNDRDGP